MSWTTGTASDHLDLLDKLVAFLSTDSTLVAASQNWTVLRNTDLPFTDSPTSGRICFSTSPGGVVNDSWPLNAYSSNVRLKITGTLAAPSSGSYTFGVLADELVEVRIDGTLIYGLYTPGASQSAWPTSFTTTLSAGNHTLDVRYMGFGLNNFLALGWQKPGDSSIAMIPAGSYSGLSIAYGTLFGNNPGNQNSAAAFAAAFAQKEVVVRGPGLSGVDQIYVGLNHYVDYAGDLYNIYIRGLTGYNSTLPLASQPGQESTYPAALLWNQPMKYWFIATGRRFIVIAKVSTVYESMYGGFLLPYGLPSEVPYPLTIGASGGRPTVRWSTQDSQHSSFWQPGSDNGDSTAPLHYRNVNGAWDFFANYGNSTPPGRLYPHAVFNNYRTDPSNNYALQPVALYSPRYGFNVYGELDGVFHVSGFSNASENVITISGQDYLVVQSAYKTGIGDYAAIALA